MGGDVVIYPDDMSKTGSAISEDVIDPFLNWAAKTETSQMLIIPIEYARDPAGFVQESTDNAGAAIDMIIRAIPSNAIVDDLKSLAAYHALLQGHEDNEAQKSASN